MGIDKSEFLKDYVTEAYEYLDSIDDIAIKLAKEKRNDECMDELLRILHTLKGSSRMMEFFQIEQIVHGMETIFKNIKNDETEVSTMEVQLMMSVNLILRNSIGEIEKGKEGLIPNFDAVMKNITAAGNGEEFTTAFAEKKEVVENQQEIFHDSQTIKIQISQIDEILQSFDKLIMRQIKLKNEITTLETHQRTDAHKHSASEDYKYFKEIDDSMSVLENQAFAIQEKIISLRMLPFDMILQPIKRSIAQDALKLGKNVDFDIPHSEITIDKTILERLPKILVHLVRNALDHGVESPEQRIAAGKSERGTIAIKVTQSSNRIFITISDDGKGIEYEKIREKASRLYKEREKEIQEMGKDDLLQFLFVSGFSTRDKATELSGRGIGLDVVRSEMDQLKGKISVTSEPGKGSSFELSLPASLATQDGLFIRDGDNTYLILSHYINQVITQDPSSFITLQNGPVMVLDKELIPVYDFSSITGKITANSKKKKTETPVVVLEYLNKRIGVMADEILHYGTVVVKPLPPVLKDFEALQGLVFDENYSIIPVLNIPDTMRRFRGISVYDIKNLEAQKQQKTYSVLIADDSQTTRHIEQIILEAEGYKVTVAGDGIEALEKLKAGHFDLVITDVKMPRMDGFVLIHNIRHTQEIHNIPVIVVSSVFEQDTNDKVLKLGAQAYIVKSDFERENLVAKARELLSNAEYN